MQTIVTGKTFFYFISSMASLLLGSVAAGTQDLQSQKSSQKGQVVKRSQFPPPLVLEWVAAEECIHCSASVTPDCSSAWSMALQFSELPREHSLVSQDAAALH